jgi:hypothetical protein
VDFGQIPAEQIIAKCAIYFNKIKIVELIGLQNVTKIENAKLWWPRGMGQANLYLAEVKLGRKKLQNIFP